jgi:ADP-heptose:LPS heptosyltransferase
MTLLVLRALGLGDGLTAVPALRGLRRLAGDRELVLACAHPVAGLLRAHGVVDAVLPTSGLDDEPPGTLFRRRTGRRHVAVNLHDRGPLSHRLLQAGEPDALVAFACRESGVSGPLWRPDEHEVSRWCRLVTWAGGPCGGGDLLLGDPGDRSGPVVVHPGAARRSRRWPPERWAAVARALAADGHDVVVTGSGPAGRRAAAAVVAGAGLPAAADLGGRLDLPALADLVRWAPLVLCGDTGVSHLATAWGTPSVTLFGPTSPRLWGPPATGPHVALWHGADAASGAEWHGDPHGDSPDPMLLATTVPEVLAAAHDLLPAHVT